MRAAEAPTAPGHEPGRRNERSMDRGLGRELSVVQSSSLGEPGTGLSGHPEGLCGWTGTERGLENPSAWWRQFQRSLRPLEASNQQRRRFERLA